MKKTAVMLMIMTIITSAVFFCPVNAATGSPAVHKSATGSSQGVTWEIDLDQYYPEQYAESGLASGQVNTMVYYRITNSNDDAAYVRNTGFTINWVTAPYITDYQTFSDDLYIGYQNTSGSWYIYADSPYSYSSGVVVPPHSSLYCIGVIITSASVNGNTISSQTISSVSLASHTVTLGDYPYGSAGQQLEEIENILDDIKSQLIFTGTITTVTDATVVQRSFQFADMGANMPTGVSGYISLKRLSGFAASEAVATALGSYTYQSVTYVRPYLVNVYINNATDHAIKSNLPYLNFQNLFDKLAKPSIISYGLDSSLIGTPNIVMDTGDFLTLQLPIKYSYDGVTYIPKGNHVVTFYLLFVFEQVNTSYAYNTAATMNNVFSISDLDLSYNTESAVLDMQYKLNEIYNYMAEQHGDIEDTAGDVNDDAETVSQQMEDVHRQEMQYFQDNQDAIEATGLNNFQFNQNHISAFTMITTQFTELWNALSDYTLVFIFTLLLSLATYIIKHEPTTKLKQYRSSVAAERAERISYYSHKNAQARANNGARNDGDSYFWDAVRRNNS